MKTLIVIPARYGSKRFPGKPLAILEGKTILERVWEIAAFARSRVPECEAIVATEKPSESCPSDKIVSFCRSKGIPVAVTSAELATGTDRVWETVSAMPERPDIVVNLQGDSPICPPSFPIRLIEALRDNQNDDVATICTRLSWEALDALREAKKTSPFSGTTVVRASNGTALWFSKNVVPAIRDEQKLRASEPLSPVLRHIGLYAYRFDALQFFASAEKSEYERLEQLEQLRFLENGRSIRLVEEKFPEGYEKVTSGIDSPQDLERAASVIKERGEILDCFA
ncbi:MAG: 3-deoxy-manno-octulosonate cytidylyltransferase [Thermoguttaceae bacterium]|nr:3-deoxy-manno-octulosonate cytidylyltransferase [Thermoguttaceae bacterium]